MSATYTKDELREFRDLVNGVSSQNQLVRIDSRLKMKLFIDRVGKETCDEMFLVVGRGVK